MVGVVGVWRGGCGVWDGTYNSSLMLLLYKNHVHGKPLSLPVLRPTMRRLEYLREQRAGGFVDEHLKVLHGGFVVEIERKLGFQLHAKLNQRVNILSMNT